MSTRAQDHHADAQRRGKRKKAQAKRTSPKLAPRDRSRNNEHENRKAAYALEPAAAGKRPSRKSTRGGANHLKPDSKFAVVEGMRKGSPEARARRSKARAARVRGGGR